MESAEPPENDGGSSKGTPPRQGEPPSEKLSEWRLTLARHAGGFINGVVTILGVVVAALFVILGVTISNLNTQIVDLNNRLSDLEKTQGALVTEPRLMREIDTLKGSIHKEVDEWVAAELSMVFCGIIPGTTYDFGRLVCLEKNTRWEVPPVFKSR